MVSKTISDIISKEEIEGLLGLFTPVTDYNRVMEVNAALCDVYNSGKLREAVRESGMVLTLLYGFGRYGAGEKGRSLELFPEEPFMRVHSGLGNIIYEGFSPVMQQRGILVYGDYRPLAEEICKFGGFAEDKSAEAIRREIADKLCSSFFLSQAFPEVQQPNK
ncbi:hypothetical protein HY501_02230 [Candidatus Woesearchaeota archaeon]|nr:hypothetical protein [Candidatus Woesearchaeota archaeon]